MKRKTIAIDLGGTLLRVALVEKNKIRKLVKKNTPKDKKKLRKELVNSVNKVLENVDKKEIRGVGVSSVGPLEKGVIKNPPNLPFKKFDLKKTLKKFGRIEVENDANCAALAESFNRKEKNMIVLTLGTGIGGGIIIENKLYKGEGNAGELGHIIIDNEKYFEELAGGKKVKKMAKEILGKELLVSELVKRKDKKSKKIIKKLANYLGQGIGSLINAFNPSIVVLAGGYKESGNKLLKILRKEVKKYVIIPNKTKIVWSKLKEPGILGASLLLK